MGKCKDCRHWQQRFAPDGDGKQLCTRISCYSGIRRERMATEKAVMLYAADLATAPDFGCVLFEPHPDTADRDDS